MIPQGTDLTFINQLPGFAQLIIYVLMGLGISAVAWKAYYATPPKEPPQQSSDVIVAGGAIADMRPMLGALEKLTEELAGIRSATDRLVDMQEKEIEERREERAYERGRREGEAERPRRR